MLTPRRCCSPFWTSRAITSVDPAGGYGTTMRMLPDGQVCASPTRGHATAAPRREMKSRRLMSRSPRHSDHVWSDFHITVWCNGIVGEVEFGVTAAHADSQESESARSLHEGSRQDVVESHAENRGCRDQFAAPGSGRGRRKTGCKRCKNAQDGDPDASRFARRQRLSTERRANQHRLQWQRRKREARAGRCRVADRNIVEDEK
jgi:hypothetical protein